LRNVLKHISGLPIANGSSVTVDYKQDKIIFNGNGQYITLTMNKIINIEYINSSPNIRIPKTKKSLINAMIRASENMGQLVISYNNDGKSKNIKLKVTSISYQFAKQIENDYKRNHKTAPRRVEL